MPKTTKTPPKRGEQIVLFPTFFGTFGDTGPQHGPKGPKPPQNDDSGVVFWYIFLVPPLAALVPWGNMFISRSICARPD